MSKTGLSGDAPGVILLQGRQTGPGRVRTDMQYSVHISASCKKSLRHTCSICNKHETTGIGHSILHLENSLYTCVPKGTMHLARTQTNGSPCLLSVLSQFLHRSNSSSQGMLLVGAVMSISIPFIRAACEVIRGDGWRYCCVFQVHVPTLLRKQVTEKSIFKTVFVSSRNMTTMRKFWTIGLLLQRLDEKCYAIIRRVSFS